MLDNCTVKKSVRAQNKDNVAPCLLSFTLISWLIWDKLYKMMCLDHNKDQCNHAVVQMVSDSHKVIHAFFILYISKLLIVAVSSELSVISF